MRKVLVLFAIILFSKYCIAQNDIQLVRYIDTIFKELNHKEARRCAITIIENEKVIAKRPMEWQTSNIKFHLRISRLLCRRSISFFYQRKNCIF